MTTPNLALPATGAFHIRPAQLADRDTLLALAAAAPEAPHWPPAAWDPYLAASAPPHLRIALVALRTGSLLGFAAASLLLVSPGPSCELDSIAVLPAARRLGIGSALLGGVHAWAASHGATRLTLEVRASNASALALYHRFGFHLAGRRPAYYADPAEDALLLDTPVTLGSVFHRENG